MAPKLDAIILATGDGDFVPLVEYLKTTGGCQVEVISFGRSSSGRLKEAVDEFVDMDADPKRYTIGAGSVRRRTHDTAGGGSWGSAKRLA